MNKMNIPYMLSKSRISEVGFGAVIKNIDTDKKAMIIDFDGDTIIACMYCAGPKKPSVSNYNIFIIDDSRHWIVLSEGQFDHGVNDFDEFNRNSKNN